MAEKERLDKLLVDRGLAASRERARALILAGQVVVAEHAIDKAGARVDSDAAIRIRGEDLPFVSRGGVKLAHALDRFAIEVSARTAIDVGASTGGFTDCLLQRGAARVFAVDVGYGQLAWKLRSDPRVVVMERTNIRHLQPESLDSAPDLAVIDASFISLDKVLPPTLALLANGAEVVALVKPQFEVGKGRVGKGGVVRDPAQHAAVIERVRENAAACGCTVLGVVESPLLGQKGNREFLLYLRKGEHSSGMLETETFPAEVAESDRAGRGDHD
jgi:23S rRNA (cytidine1920-2'-O)/16S rRNA (cytidine1409-2'-O)-methyltransferase